MAIPGVPHAFNTLIWILRPVVLMPGRSDTGRSMNRERILPLERKKRKALPARIPPMMRKIRCPRRRCVLCVAEADDSVVCSFVIKFFRLCPLKKTGKASLFQSAIGTGSGCYPVHASTRVLIQINTRPQKMDYRNETRTPRTGYCYIRTDYD